MTADELPQSAGRWEDEDGAQWTWTLEWARVGERLECVGLSIRSDGARLGWTGTNVRVRSVVRGDPVPLTSSVLRRFPIGAQMADARRTHRKLAQAWAAMRPEEHDEFMARAREWEESRAGRSGPKGLGGSHFAAVAEIYRKAAIRGNKPTKAVSDHFTVSKSAAAKWVARCREMGLLPPARKGRAG